MTCDKESSVPDTIGSNFGNAFLKPKCFSYLLLVELGRVLTIVVFVPATAFHWLDCSPIKFIPNKMCIDDARA
jgi:hypothetical protein